MSLILDALRQSKQQVGPVTQHDAPARYRERRLHNGHSLSWRYWLARHLVPALLSVVAMGL